MRTQIGTVLALLASPLIACATPADDLGSASSSDEAAPAKLSVALTIAGTSGSVVATGPIVSVSSRACLFGYGMSPMGAVAQYECLGSPDQSFQLQSTGSGNQFFLVNSNSGLCVNVNGGSTAPGATIIQYGCSNSTNEIFTPTQNSDGSFTLKAQNSGLCLEIPNFSMEVVQLDQNVCTGGANQRFILPLPANSTLVGGYVVGPNANLVGANLSGADLSNLDLTGANLTGANLMDANLTNANFTNANFTNASLTDANLTNTNLTGATGVVYSERMPDTVSVPGAGGCQACGTQ
jgi:hypothetical protein